MLRTPMILTAAALAATTALSACGSVQLGAAALTSTSRIPSSTLSTEVSNLTSAYQADKAHVQLQFARSQLPRVVLSWLLRFRVREQMAARYHIRITPAQEQQALAQASLQARQSGVTLRQLAVANGVPPDQLTELGRYIAIQGQVLTRMDGGTTPTSPTALQALGAQFGAAQCRAAKSLGIRVNPQFGQFDYRQIAVVAVPGKLAAAPGTPSPSPSGTAAPQLTPHC